MFLEYRDSQKILKKEHASAKEEDTVDDCNTLFECLEQTSEPAVGLENITEYKSSNSSTPYYHCNLEVSPTIRLLLIPALLLIAFHDFLVFQGCYNESLHYC